MLSDEAGPATLSPARATRRRWPFVLVVVLTLLAFQELVARLVFPLPEVQGFNRRLYMPRGPGEPARGPRPGISNILLHYESTPDGFSFDERLNVYGFRGADFPIAKPEGTQRIAFYGDSYVEGNGVGEDDTLAVQFARMTADQSPPVEALNLGIAGASLAEMQELVRDSVPLLKPDVAVIVLCWNDLPILSARKFPEAAPRRFAPEKPYQPRLWRVVARARAGRNIPLAWHQGPTPLFAPRPESIEASLRAGEFKQVAPELIAAVREGRCNPNVLFYRRLFHEALATDLEADPRPAASIEAMVQACRAGQCRPVVAFVPIHFQVNARYHETHDRLLGETTGGAAASKSDADNRKQQQFLAGACEKAGVEFVDLTAALRAAEDRGEQMFWPLDGHCTAAGQRVIAEALRDRIFAPGK